MSDNCLLIDILATKAKKKKKVADDDEAVSEKKQKKKKDAVPEVKHASFKLFHGTFTGFPCHRAVLVNSLPGLTAI